MLPTEIIAQALLDTNTNEAEYDPATKGINALNIVSDEVNNKIVESVREDYFFDILKVTTIDLQTEYNISTATITWAGTPGTVVNIKKVNKVAIKYSANDTYYKLMEYIAPDTLEKDSEEYAATQSKNYPFYNVQDRSIFVYPAPTPGVNQGLKMNAIYTPPKILIGSTEDWLPIQPDKHYIYSLGIQELIYKSQGKLQEAAASRAEFKRRLTELMTYLKTRVNQQKTKTMGSLDSYS